MNIYERDKMPVTASVFFLVVRVCVFVFVAAGPRIFFFCVCVGVCVAKRTPPACEILMPAVFFYTSSCSWSCGRDRCRRRRGRRPRCVHFSLAPRPRRVYRVCKYVKHYSPPPPPDAMGPTSVQIAAQRGRLNKCCARAAVVLLLHPFVSLRAIFPWHCSLFECVCFCFRCATRRKCVESIDVVHVPGSKYKMHTEAT